jgi:twinkle protein
MSDSHVIGKEPCPKCGSRDNLARYSDGHAHCFGAGCDYRERATDLPQPQRSNTKGASMSLLNGEVRALGKRGLTEETCRVWGYKVGTYNDKPVQIATYCDPTGTPVAQKLRFADKSFTVLGDGKKRGLYGQHLWRDGGKMVVITEGEIDALTVSQLQGNKWPVVSIPDGAQSAAKSVARALEWLGKFDKVVLLFDNDEPGKLAAAEAAAVLPPGKAFIGTIPGFKDANEALTAGQGKAVIDAIWGAKEYRPDGIVDIESVIERAMQPIVRGRDWPWPSLTEKTYGRRRAELYGFGGGTGIGKTTVFKQIQAHILEVDKLPIGVFALEEPVHHSAKTLAGVIDGVRYHVPGVVYEPAKLEATLRGMSGKVYLYDHFGAATFDTIVDKMRYMAHAFGVKDFFLDHLTALAATMGDDERKAIDKMMAELSALTIELDATIYYISHLTTPEGKSHEEGGRVLEKHFRGSRAIGFWTHFIFAIEGNKQEQDSPRVFRVLKDRYTGDANGLTFGLQYSKATGRLTECALPEDGPFRDETYARGDDAF